MTQVELHSGEPGMAVARADDVTGLVRLAIEQKVPVEVLERLVALQERVTERNAEMAMAEALAAFQAECPPIPKTRTATVTKNGVKAYEYKFAPLDEIVPVIRPLLTKHGLSYTHDAEVQSATIKVICTLQHIDGAKRVSTFTGPFDNSGGKNGLQAVGSSRSYGRRYTLVDVLGLITEDDDDGRAAGDQDASISDEQRDELEGLVNEVRADLPRFLQVMGVEALADIKVRDFETAKRFLDQKRGRR